MGVCTGVEYLERLRDGREVWIEGERVKDVTAHAGLKRGAQTMARLLDRQHESDFADILTYAEAGSDERYAMSFLPPRTREDVLARGRAFYDWAKWSNGMLGRTPDYLNASFTAFAGAADFFAECRDDFAGNVRAYYEKIRNKDLVLTHTLVNPQVNRRITATGLASEEVALRVVDETDAGLIVKGARLLATLGPLSDEIAVFPSTLLKAAPETKPYALAFAVANDTPGMKYICRDSYDEGKSLFDAPLSGRFEEMDCVVIFNDVLVPWERVFLYDAPELCNRAYADTSAVVHMMHQVVCKNLAKAEFIVGLLCAMTRANERDHDGTVQGQIAEAMWIAETMRALLFSAEQQAEEDSRGFYAPQRRPLDTARNLFPKMYPRLVEIVQLLGSSSLMATPCEADLNNALASDVEQYFQLANLESRDRIALFRLAHDVAVSSFGGRQQLYERFFFGPQNVMASIFYKLYDKDSLIGRVNELLTRSA
ncbi:MAG: 4-hydroxyphenylacetate 3-monooxygenase, oxygenase component [Pseudomonadota bacterium]|nr:4-hydroxyphenylacetate 3-monooxygenase, oxygenase component [Pseudomonadota bacterium]